MKIGMIAFSTEGCRMAIKIAGGLDDSEVHLFAKTVSDELGLKHVETSVKAWAGKAFKEYDALVFIGALGIAVRDIAPFISSKDKDPAVVCVDNKGLFSVPILSGHIGGANELAIRIAGIVGAVPVVTTATDINGKIAIDVFAVKNDLAIRPLHSIKSVTSRVLAGEPVGLVCDVPILGDVPEELKGPEDSPVGVYIGIREVSPFPETLHLIPRNIVAGIGCHRGISAQDIEDMFSRALAQASVSEDRIRSLASIDLKKNEKGLLEFARSKRLPITFYTAAELNSVEGEFSSSAFVHSITGVDCVCERAAVKDSRNGTLLLKKISGNGITVALVEEPFSVDFSR